MKELITSVAFDFDDWQETPEFFLRLEEFWGPHTVDCFANFHTAENCLVVPPVLLVTRALHYLSLQQARATTMAFVQLLASAYEQIQAVHERLFSTE